MPILRKSLLASAFSTASMLGFPAVALAQDPVVPPAAPLPAPPPSPSAAPLPESPHAAPPAGGCVLGAHPGIDEADATTGVSVICTELRNAKASGDWFEVHYGKLGGKIIVTLRQHQGARVDDRQVVIAGIDELLVAAPRLASATARDVPLDETRSTENVLGTEARTPKLRSGTTSFEAGLVGAAALSSLSSVSGGISLGLSYRRRLIGIIAQGRAAGVGSGTDLVGLASLDAGPRLFSSEGDTAAFVGAGIGIGHVARSSFKGSGLGAYAEVGVELLRTERIGLSSSVRIDLPTYQVEKTVYYIGKESSTKTEYVAPLSLNVTIQFR